MRIRFFLLIACLGCSASALAQSVEQTLGGAEVRTRQAEQTRSTTRERQERQRVERSLRQLDASSAPYLRERGGQIQQRRARLGRTQTGLTDRGRSNQRQIPTGPRTKIMPLGPRETNLELNFFEE